jgi:hypothetical protein
MLRCTTAPDESFECDGKTFIPSATLEVVHGAGSLVHEDELVIAVPASERNGFFVSRVQIVKVPDTKPDGTKDHHWQIYGLTSKEYVALEIESYPEIVEVLHWLEVGKEMPL